MLDVLPLGGSLESYSHDYGVATGGTGIGFGFFGPALADNFADANSSAAVPEPAIFLLFGCALAVLRFTRKG